MSVFELFLYVVFFVFAFAILIGIYFYNKRHNKILVKNRKFNLSHDKREMNIEFEKNEKFDWDIYEDDLTIEDKRFIGLNLWEKSDSANDRIDKIKKQFELNEYVFFNLIEIFMLIDLYGSEIKISDNGEFIISKLYLTSFINDLKYDLKMINRIDEFKSQYLSIVSDIEIDAKEIFFIMKNAKSFGLGNVDRHVQFFQFVNSNLQNIIIDEHNVELDKDNFIKIVIDDSGFIDSSDNKNQMVIENVMYSEENKLHKILESYKSELKKETTENGLTKITYPDGTIIIKNGPWEIEEVITPEDIEEEKSKHIETASMKKLLGSLTEELSVNKKDIFDDIESEDTNLNNVIGENLIEDKIKLLIEPKEKNIYFSNTNGEKIYFGYFNDIFNENDFENKFCTLEKNNLLIFISLFFMEEFFRVNIENINNTQENKMVSFFFTDGKKFYLVYEFIIYLLFNLIHDYETILDKMLVGKDSFSMRYPSRLVLILIKHYKNIFGKDMFYISEDKHFFYKSFIFDGKSNRANLMILNDEFVEHLKFANKNILDKASKISFLNKEETTKMKKENNIFQINFKLFKNWEYKNGK